MSRFHHLTGKKMVFEDHLLWKTGRGVWNINWKRMNCPVKKCMDIQILIQKFCDYSVSIRGYNKDTVRRYRFVINSDNKFAKFIEINQVLLMKMYGGLFYCGRIERKWSVNTFIVYHKTLLVFLRWCMKQGYMQIEKKIHWGCWGSKAWKEAAT